ncbi:NlpC/P60 family protein [Kutzneria viridogrisea]|uniref:NLP/P60-family protein n=2 Tax=Kutzneria TaxID=43356 RepID=W5W2E1_9PSEU|nr:NlpC/P60 family protein [Kutzneria albida]AHH95348.1 NLP/P60-family protein [Kutzneria albida DSM 43870]MBA8927295.1 cell wall-associated NlpC family hydrolase [Kutzneria viridogrisea]
MASDRLKYAMRGALAMTAVAAVVSMNPGSAVADPPANQQDALKQLNDASAAAEKAQQAYLAAKDDLKAKQDAKDTATHDIEKYGKDLDAAQKQEGQFRGEVDKLAAATYDGAQFTQLSALLSGQSAQDFLDQSTVLQMIASRNADILGTYDAAVNKATEAKNKAADAQKRASDAADAAAKIVADLEQKKKDADAAVAKSQAAYNQLSGAARNGLNSNGDNGVFVGPAGAAGTAMNVAVAQRGVPYVWGGTTPSGFDCSGLMLYSYAQAGVTIPRSAAAQYTVGKSVSMDSLQPGDLVFYGSTASNIHHVSMYVGSGKVVHAPTEGETVKIVPIGQSGSDIFGAKRIVG